MYRILARKLLFQFPWLSLFQETVQLPDGSESEYYIADRGDAVSVLAQTPDGKIVLINEYKHGIRRNTWQLPGGHFLNVLHARELPEEAARRELLEETGYGGGKFRLASQIPSAPHWSPSRVFLCILTGVTRQEQPDREPSEDIKEVKLVSLYRAIRMIKDRQIQDPMSALNLLLNRDSVS